MLERLYESIMYANHLPKYIDKDKILIIFCREKEERKAVSDLYPYRSFIFENTKQGGASTLYRSPAFIYMDINRYLYMY